MARSVQNGCSDISHQGWIFMIKTKKLPVFFKEDNEAKKASTKGGAKDRTIKPSPPPNKNQLAMHVIE